ncbi:hypothetical protein [Paracoccus sp. IB05]|nr:hypothetical protein [Paracoccus sp. IB05]MBJ2152908.1 hypothetical protein [Paracoccus sp. IB05]
MVGKTLKHVFQGFSGRNWLNLRHFLPAALQRLAKIRQSQKYLETKT